MLYTSSLHYAQKLKKIIKEYETYLSHKVNIKNMCTIRRKRGKKKIWPSYIWPQNICKIKSDI